MLDEFTPAAFYKRLAPNGANRDAGAGPIRLFEAKPAMTVLALVSTYGNA